MMTTQATGYDTPTHDYVYEPFVAEMDIQNGSLDVVGDIHGCMDELVSVLTRAGYEIEDFDPKKSAPIGIHHPQGRKLVFVGDLTDRGPYSDQVLRLAMGLHKTGTGRVVMGNHDWKLVRLLMGRNVTVSQGLQDTLDQIAPLRDAFKRDVLSFYREVSHQIRVPLTWETRYEGATSLWITHAAAKAHRQGKVDRGAWHRSIYGYSDGKVDEQTGHLIREDWAHDYSGADPVIHGHEVHAEPYLMNRVLCLDTGCVFGNKLTLYRVDTGEFLFEPAARDYSGENRKL